jgi:hypothetical protein
MAINIKNWAIVGGVAAGITPLFMKVLSTIPTFQVTFSTLAVDLRSKVTGVSGGELSEFLLGLTGLQITIPAMIMIIIGGALIAVLARYALSFIPFKPKDRMQLLASVFVLASLIELFVGAGFTIPGVALLLGFAVNGIVMSFVIGFLAEQLGLKVE